MTRSLNAPPPESHANGMTFGTHRSRLALIMEQTQTPEDRFTFAESEATLARYTHSTGLDNPYGSGLEAYEPNTAIFDDYQGAWDAKEDAEYEEARDKAMQTWTTVRGNVIGGPGTEPMRVDGQVGSFINAAMRAIGKPYVWGGTSLASGVDCSGLIYAAMQAAGINVPRYRAVDWGKQGAAVSYDQARAGDLVYWDNPNTTTDHVGIYLGNGKVLQAPQSGDVVKISTVWGNPQFRRIFADNEFTRQSTPGGSSYWAYGRNNVTWSSAPTTPITNYDAVVRSTSPWRRGQFA